MSDSSEEEELDDQLTNQSEAESTATETAESEESDGESEESEESSEEQAKHRRFLLARHGKVKDQQEEEEESSADWFKQRLVEAGKSIDRAVDEVSDVTQVISPAFQGTLKDFQVRGVQWLIGLYRAGYGGILADSMGCGKTIQTIAFLLYLRNTAVQGDRHRPHLVVCPLSILDNWFSELHKFSPVFSVTRYIGDRAHRDALQKQICNSLQKVDIVLTTYEMCNKDYDFFASISWHCLVVDEAHRLKNRHSLLYQNLSVCSFEQCVLLTGTPIQNNLDELHALMKFCNQESFPSNGETFKEILISGNGNNGTISNSSSSNSSFAHISVNILQSIIRPFILRREKEVAVPDLPPVFETTLYAQITDLQKKMYLDLLSRNASHLKHISLANILVQLRKCLNHPYIFPGIEPEPFQIGEHLVEASGKLTILDKLLAYLHKNNHRVLIFSQMTSMLDILQDYLEYREYSYDRLDGSIRGQDRTEAVSHFTSSDTFVFLLSTRAGGLGLNLTAADVVIFYDSDFNPQADLQAAARVHRIGQEKKVSVIRLITKATVEEVIIKRAEVKAKLAQNVLSGINRPEDDVTKDVGILKFGLSELMAQREAAAAESDEAKEDEMNFEHLFASCLYENVETEIPEEQAVTAEDTIYKFEGKDYYQISHEDTEAYDKLALIPHDEFEMGVDGVQRKRKAPDMSLEEEYARLEAERQRRRIEASRRKEDRKAQKWRDAGYSSTSLPSVSVPIAPTDEEQEEAELKHVVGSINRPQPVGNEEAIIIASTLDNSGKWSQHGVFGALTALSLSMQENYKKSHDMSDVHVGDAHLYKVPKEDLQRLDLSDTLKDNFYFAGMIAQKRNKQGYVSDIDFSALEQIFKKLAAKAKIINATIHMPHIGRKQDGTFYNAERLIKRHIISAGVTCVMYYYRRPARPAVQPPVPLPRPIVVASNITQALPPPPPYSPRAPSPTPPTYSQSTPVVAPLSPVPIVPHLPKIFNNVAVSFYPVAYEEDNLMTNTLTKYVRAYGGKVVTCDNPSATHIVVLSDDQITGDKVSAMLEENLNLKIVKPDWVIDSVVEVQLKLEFEYDPFTQNNNASTSE